MALRSLHFVACALAAGACTGPTLVLANPQELPAFRDGVATTTATQDFRYYGTTHIDALPKDQRQRPDWQHRPHRQVVALPPPASPWLFPLDLPIELVDRLLRGQVNTTVAVEVPAVATTLSPDDATCNEALAAVTSRALAARASR